MKYIALILASLGRKKIRTGLTIASFAVALFLFGILVALHNAYSLPLKMAGADRLVVIHRSGLNRNLPLSYRDKIQQVDGVKVVCATQFFGGIYQSERNFIPIFAIDPQTFWSTFPEIETPEEQKKAFFADREGAVVGITTVERFGWKLGDRVPIKGTTFPGNWEFNIRAFYRSDQHKYDTTGFFFHYTRLEEGAPEWYRGHVSEYVLRVDDPDKAFAVAKAIDTQFTNSRYRTKTDTEKAFNASSIKQVGNIGFLMFAVGSVVFFTLLLVIGNTMAMAVRERTGELAVLKAVGFSDTRVLLLVLSESVLIAIVGGAAGLAAAMAVAPNMSKAMNGFEFFIGITDLARGIGLAACVGLAAGVIPAVSSMRLRVVDALRRV
jgi:putative ABC transport system permease protein